MFRRKIHRKGEEMFQRDISEEQINVIRGGLGKNDSPN